MRNWVRNHCRIVAIISCYHFLVHIFRDIRCKTNRYLDLLPSSAPMPSATNVLQCSPLSPPSNVPCATAIPLCTVPSATSSPLITRKIFSPMSSKKLDQCKSLISFIDEPWVSIRAFNPVPPLPEPQDQCYELVKRKGKVSTCCGCKLRFDKTDSDLYILGRNEYDWHIKVEKKQCRKRYEIGRKNQDYCLKRPCILAKRPLVNTNLIEVVCYLTHEQVSLPVLTIEEELRNTVEYV